MGAPQEIPVIGDNNDDDNNINNDGDDDDTLRWVLPMISQWLFRSQLLLPWRDPGIQGSTVIGEFKKQS